MVIKKIKNQNLTVQGQPFLLLKTGQGGFKKPHPPNL